MKRRFDTLSDPDNAKKAARSLVGVLNMAEDLLGVAPGTVIQAGGVAVQATAMTDLNGPEALESAAELLGVMLPAPKGVEADDWTIVLRALAQTVYTACKAAEDGKVSLMDVARISAAFSPALPILLKISAARAGILAAA